MNALPPDSSSRDRKCTLMLGLNNVKAISSKFEYNGERAGNL